MTWLVVLVSSLVLTAAVYADVPLSLPGRAALGKEPITPAVYGLWNSIDSVLLSDDGNWAVYTLNSGGGEKQLVVRATRGGTEWRTSRSEISVRSPPLTRSIKLEPAIMTPDSKFVLFTTVGVSNTKDLGIIRVNDGRVTKVRRVDSFAVAPGSGKFLAYKTDDHALVSRDLVSSNEVRVQQVSEYVFDAQGTHLAYVVSVARQADNGVFVRRLGNGQVTPLATGEAVYRSITFDARGQRLAFLSSRDANLRNQTFSLHYSKSPQSTAMIAVNATSITDDMRISPDAGIQFKGDAITFSLVQKQRRPTPQPMSSSWPVFDLWHWNDPLVQIEQKGWRKGAAKFLSIYWISKGRWLQLETPSLARVLLSEDARYAVGIDQSQYRVQESWGEFIADVYRVDVSTGETAPLLKSFRSGQWFSNPYLPTPFSFSPSGRHLLYFQDRRWVSHDLRSGKRVDLTGALLPFVHFDLEYSYANNKRPSRPIGIAGWVDGESRILLYSRRDIWEVDLSGAATLARKLTEQHGGWDTVFRVWPHDVSSNWGSPPEERAKLRFNPGDFLLLTAFDMDTKASGIWKLQLGSGQPPEPVLMLDKQLKLHVYSKEAQQYLLTLESFREFPDLWTGQDLNNLRRISDANPQQREYRWGTAELVEWISGFGVPLQGVLMKPEGFDPHHQHPMLVYIYGLFSADVHRYRPPELETGADIWSPASFLSKGYVVFMPDIVNVMPFPGESAVSSVLPGVQSILDRGFVDRSRMGLVGHSWGGYEVGYILTRTDLFRAAIAGAGTSNSISAYSGQGILVTAYQYENGSASYGSSVWENPWVYLINSPVLLADRVRTPLLILHNETDTVVPFAQGAELYFAMRRLRKEAYLFNYNGEGHTVEAYSARFDWNQRMHEFLDHFLLDAPKSKWMRHGIPYAQKGCDVRVPKGEPIPAC